MNNGKILIVDDSENIRSVLQLNFEYLGYRVLSARDGEEALRLIQEEEPHVVVLDVMMPRQNGFQVCRKIKSDPRYASLPVVFLTAKGHREDKLWGKDCGADEYLTKPFSTAELERVIERLMDRGDGRGGSRGLEAEIEELRRRGEPFAVLTVTFDARALTTFRQKYGEFRFHEALEGVRQTVEVIVRSDAGHATVWMTGDNVLKALLPGEPDRITALRDRIALQSNLLLKSFYEGEDAARGFVLARQAPDGSEVHIPLMTIDTKLDTGSEAP